MNNGNRRRSGARAILGLSVALVLVAVCISLYRLYGYPRDVWPASQLRTLKDAALNVGVRDAYGRLISYPGKVEVACPRQTAGTAVILAIGQSNVANHATKRIVARYGGLVLSYFGGKCYIASSPLLGATGGGGEFLTLLADGLIAERLYRNVIIVPSAIGGSPISRWQRNGDLNDMLVTMLKLLPLGYTVTEVVWHQGESDFTLSTSSKDYTASFQSLLETLDENGVHAPVYLAISTKCDALWAADNPTAAAQRNLVDNKRVFLGADTDTLLTDADRQADRCHFAESGQSKTAASYVESIKRSRQGR